MSRQAAHALICKYFDVPLPYYSMGRVDTLDLFGQNELVIFALYEASKNKYRRALDIGANVGLHAMLMLRLGWMVKSYEPDPDVFARMESNVGLHVRWESVNAAVSDREGLAPFVRVINNLTGSHLAGYKDSHGPIETFNVKILDACPMFDWVGDDGVGLVKIDAEGHEAVILSCATTGHMQKMDVITEVRGEKEGAKIKKHFQERGIPIYSQKIGWKEVKVMSDMPRHHSEGSIFISARGGPFE